MYGDDAPAKAIAVPAGFHATPKPLLGSVPGLLHLVENPDDQPQTWINGVPLAAAAR